jgi:hypothetical protein
MLAMIRLVMIVRKVQGLQNITVHHSQYGLIIFLSHLCKSSE